MAEPPPDRPARRAGQLLFTGHMDTVFGADHPFQSLSGEPGKVQRPVSPARGGIAVMLAALRRSKRAGSLGWAINRHQQRREVSSLGSATLIAEAPGKRRAACEPSVCPTERWPGRGQRNFASPSRVARPCHRNRKKAAMRCSRRRPASD
jgi:glutamate carboxypeptidase